MNELMKMMTGLYYLYRTENYSGNEKQIVEYLSLSFCPFLTSVKKNLTFGFAIDEQSLLVLNF